MLFSKALDKYCEPKIAKYDILVASLKRLGRADTEKKIKKAGFELKKVLNNQKHTRGR